MIDTCPSIDINPLSPNGFIFQFNNLKEVSYFSQDVNIPGIMLGEPEFANPFSRQPIPGDSISYEPLEVTFQVDSQLKNWLSIWDWIVALGFPENYDQYKELLGSRAEPITELAKGYSDASLILLGSNNVPVKTFEFKDCFPTNLTGFHVSSMATGVQYVQATMTVKFGYYRVS